MNGLQVHLAELMSQNPNLSLDTDEALAYVAREVSLVLKEPAIRSEVYERSSEDPLVGDDINMAVIHTILDNLIEVLNSD